MLRCYYYDNSGNYTDFKEYLFSEAGITFDFALDKFTKSAVEYRISTIEQYTGAASILTNLVKAGKQNLLAGNTDISFGMILGGSGDGYALECRCYTATDVVTFEISNRTAAGFRINVLEACTLEYTAIKK